jgi:hypothetical protein
MSMTLSLFVVILFAVFILFVFAAVIIIFAFYTRKAPLKPQQKTQDEKEEGPSAEEK